MKRTLSFTFVPLDLRKILTCVAEDLVGYYFVNNNLNTSLCFSIYIYSDPTLEDGECKFIEHEDEHRVFLCSNQYDMLFHISDEVLQTRADEMPSIDFPYDGYRARCKFNHDSIECEEDYILWSVVLKDWDFDRACYFGPDVRCCPFAQNLPKDQLKWKGVAGMCKSHLCKDEDCERRIFCMTHDAEHEEIHKL